MYFSVENEELLKEYDISNDITYSIKEEFDCKPIYNKRYLKTKIKSYSDEATGFYEKEIPKLYMFSSIAD